MNIFDNVKNWFINNLQAAGGKITQDMLKNLEIKGTGAIQIDIGQIKISGVNMNIQVIDTDNKNAQLVNLNIPLNVSITPSPISIPLNIDGKLS